MAKSETSAIGTSILIAGTSHVGKSTFAAELGRTLGWAVISTDAIARHPGRPWPMPPAHVAEFYAALSDETILQFLRHHHENMWPGLAQAILSEQAAGTCRIWEGSALRPEYLAKLPHLSNQRLCFYAPAAFLRNRIHANSGYFDLSADQKALVETFVKRTIAENTANYEAATALGMLCIDTSDPEAVDTAMSDLIALVGQAAAN